MNKKQKLGENASEVSTDSCQSCDYHMTPVDNESVDNESMDISQLFQSELATARAKLLEPQQQVKTSVRSSLGHRAGFDAFMTGYALACYAMRSSDAKLAEDKDETGSDFPQPLAGLADMKNCLPSRAKNWKVPLHILKSHFVKTSASHSIASQRMKQLASQLHSHGFS